MTKKIQFSPEKYRYLEWTERGDNDKEWPKLEYVAVIWSPHKKRDIKKIERIQRAATKMGPSLRDLPYKERISRLKLPIVGKKRERGDLIEVYGASKSLKNIDRSVCVERQIQEVMRINWKGLHTRET